MKIILDVTKEPFTKGDIFVYDGKGLMAISEKEFLYQQNEKIKKQDEKIKNLENAIKDITKGVNGKLKEYHDILQTLVKGE